MTDTPSTPSDSSCKSSASQLTNFSTVQQKQYKKIGFVLNPFSGKGAGETVFLQDIKPLLKTKFKDRGVVCYTTKCQGDGIRLAIKLADEGCDLVVACGGDGTNHEVLNGLMKANKNREDKIALGILPIGSGSDFAKTLQIPEYEYEKMLDILHDGFTINGDVGYLESTDVEDNSKKVKKYFLNIASFGASAAIVYGVNTGIKIFNSDFTYNFHTLKTSLTYSNINVEYKLGESEKKSFMCYLAAICNGQYFGSGMRVSPKSTIDDGLFDIVLLNDLGFFDVLKVMSSIKSGDHIKHPKVELPGKCDTFYAEPKENTPVYIEADGELNGQLPATFTVLKKAIPLVVPKMFLDGK